MTERIKLLVVDDNADLRQRIVDQFGRMEQFNVVGAASNGVAALEMVKKQQPDVMLLDVVMPQLDGFGVMDVLSDLNIPKRPEVIMMSALTQEVFIARAIDLGARYYLAKPFDMETLKSRILDVCGGATRLQQRPHSFEPAVREAKHSIEEKISTMFISIGIPAHIKGYHFLRDGVKMVVDNPDSINRITKELYPGIAKHFNTSASKVERAIRHAIEVAWTRGKIENINRIFGYNIYTRNDKPTNGEFIALIADKLILERSA